MNEDLPADKTGAHVFVPHHENPNFTAENRLRLLRKQIPEASQSNQAGKLSEPFNEHQWPEELAAALAAATNSGLAGEARLRDLAKQALAAGWIDRADEAIHSLIGALEARRASREEFIYALNTLSSIRIKQERFEEALQSAQDVLDRARTSSCSNHELALASYNIASILLQLQRWNEAAETASEAILLEKDDRALLADIQKLQGEALLKAGQYVAARDALQEALNFLGEGGDSSSFDKRRELRRGLGQVLHLLRRFDEAIPHREWVMDIFRLQYGKTSTEYGIGLTEYALTLTAAGRYALAGSHFATAYRILSNNEGEIAEATWIARKGLAELASLSGALHLSAERFQHLFKLPGHPARIAAALLSYAAVAIELKDFNMAIRAIQKCRQIRDSRDEPMAWVRAADLLAAKKWLTWAEAFYAHVMQLIPKGDPPNWFECTKQAHFGVLGMAVLLRRKDAAQQLFAAFTALADTTSEIPFTLSVGRRAAQHLAAAGEHGMALDILARAAPAHRTVLVESIRLYGEASSHDSMEKALAQIRLQVSCLFALSGTDPARVKAVYWSLSFLHGLETRVLQIRSLTKGGERDLNVTAVQHQIQTLKNAAITKRLHGDVFFSAEHLAADLEVIREQIALYEALLLERMSSGRLDLEFLTGSEKLPGLPADSALIEFTIFQSVSGKAHYAAFVIRDGGEQITPLDLGSAETINQLVDQFRSGVIRQGRDRNPASRFWEVPGRALRSLIVDPWRPVIGSLRKVAIIPENRLCLVSFAALPEAHDGFVGQQFEINYLMSNRPFRAVNFHDEDYGLEGKAVVLGNPNYDLHGDGQQSSAIYSDESLEQFRSAIGRFDALGKSGEECKEIAEMFNSDEALEQFKSAKGYFNAPGKTGEDHKESGRIFHVEALTQKKATKAEMLAVDTPEALHISTHGFVLDYNPAGIGRTAVPDPLDRSGLAFAGANADLDGATNSDGFLFASEVAALDLHRTDIVTLSACQTGLGDVVSGDGVHSLQRAFTAAGARSVVASLWEIPDIPAKILFTSFYKSLLAGASRGQALHNAIDSLSKRYPQFPVAWGGFVLYGETGPLSRFSIKQVRMQVLTLDSRKPSDPTPAERAEVLIVHGQAETTQNVQAAIDILTEALSVEGIPQGLVAKAQVLRGIAYRNRGKANATEREDYSAAIGDFTEILELANVPRRLRSVAFWERAVTYGTYSELVFTHLAISDCSSVLEIAYTPLERATPLLNRATFRNEVGDWAGALEDADEVLGTPGSPEEIRIDAMLLKAQIEIDYRDANAGEANAQLVLDRVDSPVSRATAYLLLAQSRKKRGDLAAARSHIDALRAMSQIPIWLQRQADELWETAQGTPPCLMPREMEGQVSNGSLICNGSRLKPAVLAIDTFRLTITATDG